MIQDQTEINRKFDDLKRTVEQMTRVIIDRLDRIDEGHLVTIGASVAEMIGKVQKMEAAVSKFEKDLRALEIQVMRVGNKIDIATAGRTQWERER